MEKKKNGHMLPQVGERHPFFCLVMLKGIGWNKAWPASACLCMCVCVCVYACVYVCVHWVLGRWVLSPKALVWLCP